MADVLAAVPDETAVPLKRSGTPPTSTPKALPTPQDGSSNLSWHNTLDKTSGSSSAHSVGE
jgi:hypothetical protein